MNLNMIRPKHERQDSLLSITKKCETLIEQSHRKAEETLEFKMTKPREAFHFKPPIQVKDDWTIGLTDLEVYISIFNITEENNKLQVYKFPDEKPGVVTYERVRDDIGRDLDISDTTAADLQDDLIAPINIEEYKEQVTKRMKNEQYMNIVAGYVSSVFQDFKSYLRTEEDLVEDDIKLVLDEYNSSFIKYEVSPGIYTFNDVSGALFKILRSEYPEPSNVIDIEYNDINMKTKLVLKSGIIAVKFDEKSFFKIVLGFTPGWDYKHYDKYISQKVLKIGSRNKIHLKCDIIDGSVVNGLRQPILYSFVLDKLPGYRVFCATETIHYKKNKSVLNTITFYLEDNNNEEVDFNGEMLTFTLQMIKI